MQFVDFLFGEGIETDLLKIRYIFNQDSVGK